MPRVPLSLIVDHIDHIVKVAGIDHVGLGSDFDGISAAPEGLGGVQDYPNLRSALASAGFSEQEQAGILGGNMRRVLADVLS